MEDADLAKNSVCSINIRSTTSAASGSLPCGADVCGTESTRAAVGALDSGNHDHSEHGSLISLQDTVVCKGDIAGFGVETQDGKPAAGQRSWVTKSNVLANALSQRLTVEQEYQPPPERHQGPTTRTASCT